MLLLLLLLLLLRCGCRGFWWCRCRHVLAVAEKKTERARAGTGGRAGTGSGAVGMRRVLLGLAAATTLVVGQEVDADAAAAKLRTGYKPSCEAPLSNGQDDTAACDAVHKAFLDWLDDGGATISPAVEIRTNEKTGMRGLHAKEPVSAGTELASVPRSLWLDESVAMESKVGDLLRTVKEKAKGMPPHVPTLIWLVHERLLGSASDFDPYFQYLPKYDNLVYTFSDSARKLLIAGAPQGVTNRLVHEVWHDGDLEFKMLSAQIWDPRPQLFPQAPPGSPPNSKFPQRLRAAYDWAVSTVYSRMIGPDTRELTSVVPFLDLPNHANSASEGPTFDIDQLARPEGWEVADQVDGIVMVANRDYEAGEELLAAYDNVTIQTWPLPRNPECHSRMLTVYGFTDGHTNRDCFTLYINPKDFMKPADPKDQPEDEDYRLGLLQTENVGPKPIYIWDLRSDLSSLGATVAKVLRILMLPSITELANGADSEVDEIEVWKTIQRLVKEQGAIQRSELAKMETFASELPEGSQPYTDGTNAALRQWFGTATEGMKRVQKKLEKKIKSK